MGPPTAQGRGGVLGSGSQEEDKEKKDEKYKYTIVSDAKDLLDKIGEHIYEKAKKDADKYRTELHGFLSLATYPNDRNPTNSTPSNPCLLEYQYHTNVTNKVIEPCNHKSKERFSDTKGSECDDEKIEGNNKGTNGKEGACAPYRRLHLCDQHLEHINSDKITTHNLLADVCQAAQYEGRSIRGYYARYDEQYPSSVSTICTALARSFADIGDIIRGKDMYRRNKEEKTKLENKLKEYFKEIYEELIKKKEDAKNHYGDDPNYYKLREDWWYANRQKVWRAITCKDRGGAYFRATCGDKRNRTSTQSRCRCINFDVPTFFDYVPQFLRWFEEWAEDFCRKRKKKLQNAITKCRHDEKGNHKYCDLNGYDCKQTARGKNQLASDSDCNKCSVACKPFVEWLDKQKEEFNKQKNKYAEEITKKDKTTIRIGDRTINNLYVGDFYKKLHEYYPTVDEFLKKLNDEAICKYQTKIGDEKESHVDFTKNDLEDIFSHTEICQACPWCGMKCEGGKCKKEAEGSCNQIIQEEKWDETNTTDIEILTYDKGNSDILDKYKTFCDNADGNKVNQIQKDIWKCHYEGINKNKCVLQNNQKGTNKQKDMSYNVFFYHSIIDILNDSIEWKRELKECFKNNNKKCENGCRKKCECYKRWIQEKKKELQQIEKHFNKQTDIDADTRDMTLKMLLNYTFLNDIRDAYAYKQQMEKIERLLKDKIVEEIGDALSREIVINEFLDKEEEFAQNCLQKQEECERQKQKEQEEATRARGRAEIPRDEVRPTVDDNHSDESDEEEHLDDGNNEDREEIVEEVVREEQSPPQPEAPQEPSGPKGPTIENICNIVGNALTDKNLQEACDLKYNKGKNYGWKCVSSDKTATGESGDPKRTRRSTPESGSSVDKGAICIPPRRRKLYIGGLKKWAKTQLKTQDGGEGGETKGTVTTEGGSKGETRDGDSSGEAVSGKVEGGNGEAVTQEGGANTAGDGKAGSGEGNPGDSSVESTQADTASRTTDVDPLLAAFVESAAVETFFLWHRYKKIKNKEAEEKKRREAEENGLPFVTGLPVVGGPSSLSSQHSYPGALVPRGPAGSVGLRPDGSYTPGPQGIRGPEGGQLDPNSEIQDPSTAFSTLQTRAVHFNSGGSERLIFQDLDGESSRRSRPQLKRLHETQEEDEDTSNSSPEATLLRGDIPAPFLRQMFYTLGDYRDILVHGGENINGSGKDVTGDNTNNDKTNIVLLLSEKDEQTKMKDIQKAIDDFLKKQPVQSSRTPGSPPDNNPLQQRQTLWQNFAPQIWHGMICALTYEEEKSGAMPSGGSSGITQNKDVYKKFFGNNGTSNDPIDKYKYSTVTIGGNDDTSGPKLQKDSPLSPSNGSTTLAAFVTRPAYFRWLEEWGEEFCVKRKEMLAKIKEECMEEDDRSRNGGLKQKCSCYGEHCDDQLSADPSIDADLKCPDCAKSCRSYKRWIRRKKDEFTKQKEAYGEQKSAYIGQKDKCEKENGGAKEFCGTVTTSTSAADFLNKLGPCKKDSGEGKTIFDDKTFRPADNCKPCSQFTVDCKNCKGGGTQGKCNGKNKTITKQDIENNTGPNGDIEMRVSDNGTTGFDDLKECTNANIFEGIRKEEWLCHNICGYVVCKPEKLNGKAASEKPSGENKIITIRGLVTHWVQNFLEDYKKIRKKLKPCIENGKGDKCICGCNDKYKCVGEWITKKRKEWDNIKKRYLDQYKNEDQSYPAKTILEKFQGRPEFKEAIGPCPKLDDFLKSIHCNGTENSKKHKDGTKYDGILCLLNKLEKKAEKCEHKHSGDTQPTCADEPPLEDEEDLSLEEETENENQKQVDAKKKMMPSFCKIETLKEEETVETCGGDEEKDKEKEEQEGGDGGEKEPAKESLQPVPQEPSSDEPKQDPVKDTEIKDESKKDQPKVVPKEDKKSEPPKPVEPPQIVDKTPALVTSTLAWSIGIGFVALTYWFLK
ncbi:erythrocyte membrane protein 1, EMP1, partial [Plasmodium reichenowi]